MSGAKSSITESVLGHQFSTTYNIPIEKFFQFALSVDCIIIGYHDNSLKLLVVRRDAEPHKNEIVLPGALVYPNEDMDNAANRIVNNLTGLEGMVMTQSKSYGKVDRHPVGRVLTVGFYLLISRDVYELKSKEWADNVHWINVSELPDMVFDHKEIVNDFLENLKERAQTQPIGFDLLPKYFTLGEIQSLYEEIFDTKFDKGNFRKKVLNMGVLIETSELRTQVAHRPARLFKFNRKAYEALSKGGFTFDW